MATTNVFLPENSRGYIAGKITNFEFGNAKAKTDSLATILGGQSKLETLDETDIPQISPAIAHL